MNKNQTASAPDCFSLILKRDKDSENWVEIISSKHQKVKVFNLGLSFLDNFYIRESKKLLNAIYSNIFFTTFFFCFCLAMNKDLTPTSNPPEPRQ